MKVWTKRIGLVVVTLGLVIGATGQARAGLVLGTMARGTFSLGGNAPFVDQTSTLVDPGREFTGFFVAQTPILADLTATTIRVGLEFDPDEGSFTGSANDQDITFSITGLQLDPGEEIVGLSVLTNSRNNGGAVTASTTANSITIIFSGFAVGARAAGDNDDSITYTILTANPAVVPEPSTLAGGLLGIALAGGAWLKRRGTRAARP